MDLVRAFPEFTPLTGHNTAAVGGDDEATPLFDSSGKKFLGRPQHGVQPGRRIHQGANSDVYCAVLHKSRIILKVSRVLESLSDDAAVEACVLKRLSKRSVSPYVAERVPRWLGSFFWPAAGSVVTIVAHTEAGFKPLACRLSHLRRHTDALCRYFEEVLTFLATLHVHEHILLFDRHPNNVLVDKQGRTRHVDFAWASVIGTSTAWSGYRCDRNPFNEFWDLVTCLFSKPLQQVLLQHYVRIRDTLPRSNLLFCSACVLEQE